MIEFKRLILLFIILNTTTSKLFRRDEKFKLEQYHSYDSMINWLEEMQKKFSNILDMTKIGTTFENRSIYMMSFTMNVSRKNPIILIDANIHAREWASSAAAMNLINELTHSPHMLKNVDWHIIPMVNPDGYEFSRIQGNRMWRKNRSIRPESPCHGVDLNRNYDIHWLETGSHDDPCNFELYAGPYPLSELETQVVSDVMMSYKQRIKLYITLHTFGNMLLYPYGYTKNLTAPNAKNLHDLGHLMAKAIKRVRGEHYKVGPAGDLYEASGGSDDYGYCVAKIPYVYTFELTNDYIFSYPESMLQLLYADIMPAFEVAAKVVSRMRI